MMYNRAAEHVELLRALGTFDEYGTKNEYAVYGRTRMYITLYNQQRTEDARYKDVTHVGYTDCLDMSDDMIVRTERGELFKVLLVNDYARRTVVFLMRTEL